MTVRLLSADSLVNAIRQDARRRVHMKQGPRIDYSNRQKALMRERWRRDDSLQKTAQLFGRDRYVDRYR